MISVLSLVGMLGVTIVLLEAVAGKSRAVCLGHVRPLFSGGSSRDRVFGGTPGTIRA
jgi:hypothetical protein